MTDMTPLQFFEAIYRQPLRHGQLMLWSKIRRSGKTMTDWCFSLQQAARQVELYRNRREVFFGVALQDRQKAFARARQRNYRAKPTRVRGCEESVTALPALWAELAVSEGEKRSTPWGAGGDKCSALEAMSPPPSMVVLTGAAYQAYWLLAELWVLEDEEDHRRARRLLRKVQWALAGAGAGARDLAGRMQVAGTFHHLGNRRMPVGVDRHPRSGADGLWTAADFEHLDDPPSRPRDTPWPEVEGDGAPLTAAAGADLSRPPGGGRGGDLSRPLGGRGGHLQPVWRGCSWLRHCYDHQATLPEGEWTAALSIVGRCQAGPAIDGASLARSFSQRHPGYLPHLTDQALDRVLNRKSGAATCRRIGRDLEAWDGYALRSYRRQGVGGRALVSAGQTARGSTWTVRTKGEKR